MSSGYIMLYNSKATTIIVVTCTLSFSMIELSVEELIDEVLEECGEGSEDSISQRGSQGKLCRILLLSCRAWFGASLSSQWTLMIDVHA